MALSSEQLFKGAAEDSPPTAVTVGVFAALLQYELYPIKKSSAPLEQILL